MTILKKYRNKYWYPLVLLLVMVVVGLMCKPVFYLNDDVTMRSILSGAYTGTPDGHAVYMQYPLTALVAACYSVLPMVPWLELFFAGCIWVCMVLFTDAFEKKWVGVLCAVVLFLPFFLYMHYTIVAALVGGTAVFLICRGKATPVSLILLWVAYMIRSQVGLLALPFAAGALVWCMLKERDGLWQRIIRAAKYMGILVAGLLLVVGINRIFYAGAEWQDYLAYNDSRTLLYDYTDFLSTDKYAEVYGDYGMTEEEYQLLYSYNTMLDADLDKEKLQEVAVKVSEGMEKEQNVLKKYYIQFRYSDFPYNYIWLGAMVLLAGCFVWNKKWLQLVYLGLLGAGRSCIWMYLLWQGRFPERVSVSLYLLELLLLMGIALTAFRIKKPGSQRLATGGLLVILLVAGGYLGKTCVDRVKERNEIQTEWDYLKTYCRENPRNTYFLDVFSSVKYADRLFAKDCDNLLLLGGWLAESPLAQERITSLGGKDAGEVLFGNEASRLIVFEGRDVTWLKEYLQTRFDTCELVQVDSFTWRGGGFYVYELQ